MDKFWVEEVHRVTKALRDRRPSDSPVFRLYMRKVAATQSHCVPIFDLLCRISVFILYVRVDLVQEHDLCSVVSFLSDAAFAAKHALRSARISASAVLDFTKGDHRFLMLRAEVKFTENRKFCVEFFQECIRYGKTVVMAFTSFTSYSPFSQSRTSQVLVDRAARLGTEKTEVVAYTAIQGVSVYDLVVTFIDEPLQSH
ncbi:hypothetical protein BJV78DRAFT_1285319 [Lactifluus subvellereus]|nr:hypothetical protein BJV78DRAFT_1285319 [Lactifluus subvellereus]